MTDPDPFGVWLAQRELLEAQQRRVRAVQAARDAGVSWAAIGRALGMTEAGARGILRRAESEPR